jgi:hypothetical protein
MQSGNTLLHESYVLELVVAVRLSDVQFDSNTMSLVHVVEVVSLIGHTSRCERHAVDWTDPTKVAEGLLEIQLA